MENGTYIQKLKNFEKTLSIQKKGITVTVSGKSGVGKNVVSKTIAEHFKLKHVTVGDIFREESKKLRIRLEDSPKKRSAELDLNADKKTLELAKNGGVVLNGRLTGWVAGDNADVRVWVSAPMRLKSKWVAGRDKKSISEAREDILKRDLGDEKLYKNLYGIDINNTSIYDVKISNSGIPIYGLKRKSISKTKKILNKKSKVIL